MMLTSPTRIALGVVYVTTLAAMIIAIIVLLLE
jgi:hypothetical protein